METERRKFPRIECRTGVQYRHIHQPSAVFATSLTKDVSAGGVLCLVDQFHPRESRLLMQITVPGVPAPIRTIAQVVWIRKQPYGDRYDAGLQFVEMVPEDRAQIKAYVDRSRTNPSS